MMFNSSSANQFTWTNVTQKADGGISVPIATEAELVYIPLGKAGILLSIGGYQVQFEH